MMIVINDRGFNDGRGLYLCVYGPHADSTNVHDSHDGRGFHCRGRDLVQRSMMQLSMIPHYRMSRKQHFIKNMSCCNKNIQ